MNENVVTRFPDTDEIDLRLGLVGLLIVLYAVHCRLWAWEASTNCWTGTETILGVPMPSKFAFVRKVWRICVITLLMTAAIWPLQSNTGSPEAP
jgi:hypothetical protein